MAMLAAAIPYIAAGAAVVGSTVAVVSAIDTARRAEHAVEDSAVQTRSAILWEQKKAAQEIEDARTKAQRAKSTIIAQTGKMGFKLAEDTSPAFLIDYSNEQLQKDIDIIRSDSEMRINTRNWNQARTESQASALIASSYAGAFSGISRGLSDLAITSKGYKLNSTT